MRAFTLVELFTVSDAKRALRPRSGQAAFTLVELLVVITIIVILMALLVPAMESAIYQAELVQCAAKQKAVASGFNFYTHDNQRSYPTNVERRQSQDWAQPDFLGAESEPTRDLRPVVWPSYIAKLDMFLDPLAGQISTGYEENNGETRVFGNYLVFAGWDFPKQIGQFDGQGFFKYGDRLEYYDFETKTPGLSRTILMDNHLRMWPVVRPAAVQSSHPSRGQELTLKVRVNQDLNDVEPRTVNPALSPLPAFGVPGVGTQLTYSVWLGGVYPKVDLNTTSDDLSVHRYVDVEQDDTRFRPAQVHASFEGDQSVHIFLPGN